MIDQLISDLQFAYKSGDLKKASALCQLLGMHFSFEIQFGSHEEV